MAVWPGAWNVLASGHRLMLRRKEAEPPMLLVSDFLHFIQGEFDARWPADGVRPSDGLPFALHLV